MHPKLEKPLQALGKGEPVSKVKVLIRGPVLTSSGYGVHARQVCRWLLSREKDWNLEVLFQALPWGQTPWLINPELEDGLVGKIIEKTVDPTGTKFDASVQIQLPNEWDPNLAKYNIGVTAAVETDRCHPDWVVACNRMNGVVFPSEHARKSITNVGKITVPNFVVPEAYAEAFSKDPSLLPTLPADFDTTFNFLMVGQLTGTTPDADRKNILNALRMLCETFSNDKDVGIILKTNLGRNTNIDRHNVHNILAQVCREVRRTPFPKIHLVHGMMTDEEMASLYRHPTVKAFLAPTRGEGFGLPILESAVCGVPMIATSWSGHTEFLSQGKFIGIDYDLIEVDKSRIDGRIFMEGSRWARVNESDFKKKVKKFRDSSSVPREWARDLQKTLLDTHSQKAIEKKYDDLFEGVFKK